MVSVLEMENVRGWVSWKPRCTTMGKVWQETSSSITVMIPTQWRSWRSASKQLIWQHHWYLHLQQLQKRNSKCLHHFSNRKSKIPWVYHKNVCPFVRKCTYWVIFFSGQVIPAWMNYFSPLIANQSFLTPTDAYRICKSSVVNRKLHLFFIHVSVCVCGGV